MAVLGNNQKGYFLIYYILKFESTKAYLDFTKHYNISAQKGKET